jgi:vacuolar protein sorting-associated protein VTA1
VSTTGGSNSKRTTSFADDEGFYEPPPPARRHSPPYMASTGTSSLQTVGEEHGTTAVPSSPPSSAGSSSSRKRRSRAGSLSIATPPVIPAPATMGTGSRRVRTNSMSSASSNSAHSAHSINRIASPTHFVPRGSPPSSQSQLSSSNLPTPASVTLPSHTSGMSRTSPSLSTTDAVKPSIASVELTPSVIAKAQKHCRFAISALDYEDAEQARKELRMALALLGE